MSKNEDKKKEEYFMYKDKKTAMVGVLVAALILSLITLMIPAKALAVVSAGLELNLPIGPMDSSIRGCHNCLDIVSWNFTDSVTGTTAAKSTGATSVSKVFKFTMRTSRASQVLMDAAERKHKIAEVKLYVENTFDKASPQIEISFKNVVISSFFHMGTAGPNITTNPTEEVTFTYEKSTIMTK